MTQSRRTTALHLTPAVVSAVTGTNLTPKNQTLAVIWDISGGTIPAELVPEYRDQIRAELIRQIPWLAEIRVPDFGDPDTNTVKCMFIAGLTAACGGSVEIECGTITGPALPTEVPPNAKIVRNR